VTSASSKSPEPESLHDEVKRKLIEIGRIQKFLAEGEYQMDEKRLDVVWRRIDKGVPTYVFEVQVGGDLYHALGKLKHAYDLWNSNIFLVTAKKDLPEALNLLSGTYHEIKSNVRVIELPKIDELLRLKKQYKEFETRLGIT
jgi:predicted RNA-binding protein